MPTSSPTTALTVRCERLRLSDGARALAACLRQLDHRCGLALACDVEQPGRYQRRLIAFVDPPVAITGRGQELTLTALSPRGRLLLPVFAAALAEEPTIARVVARPERVKALLRGRGPLVDESARLDQPTLVNALRPLLACLRSAPPPLGLYGTLGYDLVFQLDELAPRLPRDADQRDLVLFLPDRLLVEDAVGIEEHRFEFLVDGASSLALPGDTAHRTDAGTEPAGGETPAEPPADLPAGGYAALVELARERFRCGDLFEAVLSHTLRRRCVEAPSGIFARLRAQDPAPFGFFANLGEGEVLVGASPERFVRVQDGMVDSAPISGTIPRGVDAIADADAALALLASAKDHAELTMCTDVDRNDKARICRPGSVRVVARRQIEVRSRLLHTVDQVVGTLAEGRDAIAALQAHQWAVTVTGAPKLDAMRFIEATEATPRRWYGGAVGVLGADGGCDTGLVLRTVRLSRGIAEVRVGATLLHASEPAAEEAETLLKAASVLAALAPSSAAAAVAVSPPAASRPGRRVLLVDHRDSFVHTLADYLRRLGAEVAVVRAGFDPALLGPRRYDLVVLSPGPGTPQDLGVPATIAACVAASLPVFGVCLGLQGLVVWAGGELGVLPAPMHGVASEIEVLGGGLFSGLPRRFRAGRYHSLHASRLPECLRLTARDAAGTVMAVEHRQLPLAAVQFHPESLLTETGIGLGILENALLMAVPGAPEHVAHHQAQAAG